MLLEVKWEFRSLFLFGTVILGFLSIFMKTQASSPFEALNSTCLAKFNICEDPIQMMRAPRSFSRFSTRDSYIALSCAMKDVPAFKPLQGNPTFFRVRASQYPLYLRQQSQRPSHIPIVAGMVLLRCLWKVGLLLQ